MIKAPAAATAIPMASRTQVPGAAPITYLGLGVIGSAAFRYGRF